MHSLLHLCSWSCLVPVHCPAHAVAGSRVPVCRSSSLLELPEYICVVSGGLGLIMEGGGVACLTASPASTCLLPPPRPVGVQSGAVQTCLAVCGLLSEALSFIRIHNVLHPARWSDTDPATVPIYLAPLHCATCLDNLMHAWGCHPMVEPQQGI